jgi:isopenicillin-N N-acyltransferase like protein
MTHFFGDTAKMARTIFLTLICSLAAMGSLRADPPFRYPEAKCAHGELKYINGIPVLSVDGTPDEIGSAVGLLALRPGKRMASYPDDILKEICLPFLRLPLLHAGREMVNQFPSEYRWELEAMVHAAHVDRDLAVLGNTMFDLKKFIACSALLVEPVRSTTGGALLGRNLDYPSLGYAHEYTLVTVYRPQNAKHAFATVGFPGHIGCLSGMNDAGLAVAVLEVHQVRLGEKHFDHNGTPYALCYRRILEECSTIGEAHALLEKMQRTGLSNLVVADRNGVAAFEITPERIVVRRAVNGTCACANHFCTEELRPAIGVNFFGTHDRFASLARVGEMQRLLSPTDLQVALHGASFKTFTLQTMVFECAGLQLNLATGSIPASAGEMKVLDLAPLLGP